MVILDRLRGGSSRSGSKERDDSPFFILGCVRSGTTMLRNVLRRHPRLECPEETHFFRWSDPFASGRYLHPYRNNEHIRQQQDMDGISPQEFEELVRKSASRAELAENYGRLYLKKQGNSEGRWFDKTPQNIYGILLIGQQFPDSRIIHIYRNPLNVVASLFEGKVMALRDMTAATSYWNEAMAIMSAYRKLAGERLLEISYEAFTSDPVAGTRCILEFIGEDPGAIRDPGKGIHPERNRYRDLLSEEQVEEVKRRCNPWFGEYGYS